MRLAAVVAGLAGIAACSALITALLAPPTSSASPAAGGSGGIMGTAFLPAADNSSFAISLLEPAAFAPSPVAPTASGPTMPTVTGAHATASLLLTQLSDATAQIEAEGYAVGYMLLDVSTGITISYNANTSFYSASSIKGPYVASLVRYELGDNATREARRICSVLVYSDNSAYSSLRRSYGSTCFATMVAESGAQDLASTPTSEAAAQAAEALSSGDLSNNNYEFYSPNQLVALWQECYEFLCSDEPGATWLAEQFEQPETSAIRPCASTLGTTWSKAGWYPADDGEAWATTVDAGVVRASNGDFILAVMITAPEDFSALESIISPLIAVRNSLL